MTRGMHDLSVAQLMRAGRLVTGHSGTPEIPAPLGWMREQAKAKDRPTFLIPIFDLSRRSVTNALATVATLQLDTNSFRPVIFTDDDVMSLVRPHGWAVEHHMNEHHWEQIGQRNSWEDSVIERAQYLVHVYGIDASLWIDAEKPDFGLARQVSDLVPGIAITQEAMGKLPNAPTQTSSEQPGWRGWLRPALNRASVTRIEDGNAELTITPGRRSDWLIVDQAHEADESSSLIEDARSNGWSVALLQRPSEIDLLTHRRALRALCSAASTTGLVMLFAEQSADHTGYLPEGIDYLIRRSDTSSTYEVSDRKHVGYRVHQHNEHLNWAVLAMHSTIRGALLSVETSGRNGD